MQEQLRDLYRVHVEALAKATAEALESEGYASLVAHSGSLVKRSEFDDQYWPLRPVPHFQHWAHLEWPDCAVHFIPGKKPRLIVLRDKSFWERPTEPDWSFLSAVFEIVEAKSLLGISELLTPKDKLAFVGDNARRAAEWGVLTANVNPKGLLSRLDELRVFKSPYEIACIAEANRIASRGHKAVRDAFVAGERSELKLHLLYLEATSQDDSETPYKNIVAIGDAASILHHVHYRRTPVHASSLLLDAGATYRGYASDITRTYSIAEGEASTLFADLIARMESMQKALCDGARV